MARVKPLAELIESCIGPAYAAQGFATTDILDAWPAIVGDRLAQFCQPVKLEWPRRRGGQSADVASPAGTLVVRVESVFALELQHLAPVVLQRINAHYGWACVGRLVLKQDRIRRGGTRPAKRPLDPVQRGAIALAVSRIETDGLREALDRLGVAIATSKP